MVTFYVIRTIRLQSPVFRMGGFFPQDLSATNQVIGFRNRIINGNMRIDQRNVGSAVSLNAAAAYITDRFYCNNALAVATTFQQGVLGNSGFPPRIANQPFTHCLTWNNSSTASTATNSVIYMYTSMEGNTVVDLNWGFAGARVITLSFWAYVSVVGTYSACLQNNGFLTGYVTSFQITTINTWQKFNVSIPGPVIGAWSTDTNLGLGLTFTLHGSTGIAATSTLNTWQTTSTQYYIASTQTNLALTASSTFAVTGIQLEIGSLATQFEWRPWETEMRMCQRYYEKSWQYSIPTNTNFNTLSGTVTDSTASTSAINSRRYKVTKRTTTPTVRFWNYLGSLGSVTLFGNNNASAGVTINFPNEDGWAFLSGTFNFPASYYYFYDANADF